MSTRIVICVDLVPDRLEGAYYDLFQAMAKSGLDWESSDEWYQCDGERVSDDDAQAAREAVYGRLHPESRQGSLL